MINVDGRIGMDSQSVVWAFHMAIASRWWILFFMMAEDENGT